MRPLLRFAVLLALGLLALVPAGTAQAHDRPPDESGMTYRVPRVPWKGNDYSNLQGNGIGQGGHTDQAYYALDFGKIGIDDRGLPVIAIDNGTAFVEFQDPGCGLYIKVEHTQYGLDLTSLYCHLNSVSIPDNPNGTRINLGQRIGDMGCTGTCTGAHLHFVIYNQDPCSSQSCSVARDGAGWNKNTRTGRPYLSSFSI